MKWGAIRDLSVVGPPQSTYEADDDTLRGLARSNDVNTESQFPKHERLRVRGADWKRVDIGTRAVAVSNKFPPNSSH